MRWPWAVVVAAAVAAFLAGVGTSLAPAAAPKASSSPVSTTARAAAGDGVLATLARPQQPGDRPRIPVGARLRPATFRIIDHGTVADLFVARDTSRGICLVAVTVDDQFAAACGQDPNRLPSPLWLRFSVATPGGAPASQLLALLPATG